MKIVAILECLSSETDRNGNRYWAFQYTDCLTGKTVSGTISGGESNIRQIMYVMNGGDWEPRNIYYTHTELKKSEFKKLTEHWAYAGCRAEDEIVPFIKTALTKGE